MAQATKWVGGRWQSGFKREIALLFEGRIDRRIIGSGQVQESDTVPAGEGAHELGDRSTASVGGVAPGWERGQKEEAERACCRHSTEVRVRTSRHTSRSCASRSRCGVLRFKW